MTTCIDLMERFGDRYRVSYEPARADHPHTTDPWDMQIRCRRGTIYPFDGTTLAVELDGHCQIIGRLRRLGCCRLHQLGDGDATFLFDVEHFDQVAAVVLPYRRPQLTDEQRQRLRDRIIAVNADRSKDLDLAKANQGVKSKT